MEYYRCVLRALENESLKGDLLDKGIVGCKVPLEDIQRHIEKTNEHAAIKVRRCTRSQRAWAVRMGGGRQAAEEGEWECMNRYHRRYLYYYPRLRDEQYARYFA